MFESSVTAVYAYSFFVILLMFNIALVKRIFVNLCRTRSRVVDVEHIQTAFAFMTKSETADRLFVCRQQVETTAHRS